MKAWLAIISFLAWAAPLGAEPTVTTPLPGRRPQNSIHDPAKILDTKITRELAEPLMELKHAGELDLVVVVLADLGNQSPSDVALRYARAWCDAPLEAVILHISNHPEGPWIIPFGPALESLDPERRAESLSKVMERVKTETTEANKIRTATLEATALLKQWQGAIRTRDEQLRFERHRLEAVQHLKAQRMRVIMWTGLAATVPVLLGMSAFIIFLRPSGPRFFPEINPPHRLGAPHCGGNHLSASLTR